MWHYVTLCDIMCHYVSFCVILCHYSGVQTLRCLWNTFKNSTAICVAEAVKPWNHPNFLGAVGIDLQCLGVKASVLRCDQTRCRNGSWLGAQIWDKTLPEKKAPVNEEYEPKDMMHFFNRKLGVQHPQSTSSSDQVHEILASLPTWTSPFRRRLNHWTIAGPSIFHSYVTLLTWWCNPSSWISRPAGRIYAIAKLHIPTSNLGFDSSRWPERSPHTSAAQLLVW